MTADVRVERTPAWSILSALAATNRLPVWRRPVRVWDFTVVPPTCDRLLYLTLHKLGVLGTREEAFLRSAIEPGMHVVDAGANIGLYSLLFARTVGPQGRVYSFEPDTLMAAALRENLVANGVGHAEVFAAAVGASSGRGALNRNVVHSGDNRLGVAPTRLHSDRASVPICSLSEVLAGRRVDFVKMDVQGWEGEALSGIGGVLETNPGLRIYFEFWPHGLVKAGTSIARFAEIVRNLGLHVSRPLTEPAVGPLDLEALAHMMKRGSWVDLLASRDV